MGLVFLVWLFMRMGISNDADLFWGKKKKK